MRLFAEVCTSQLYNKSTLVWLNHSAAVKTIKHSNKTWIIKHCKKRNKKIETTRQTRQDPSCLLLRHTNVWHHKLVILYLLDIYIFILCTQGESCLLWVRQEGWRCSWGAVKALISHQCLEGEQNLDSLNTKHLYKRKCDKKKRKNVVLYPDY